jgi:5-formyltetrahydrofolate cyclo-ligase
VSTKSELRGQLIAARRRRDALEVGAARAAVRRVILASPLLRQARCVAAYVPLPSEPGSPELLDALVTGGFRVLVPVLLPDNDLDWTDWTDWTGGTSGANGPGGSPLGADAIASADLVLVPALAVARDGTRLGRGGGSYDRALARVPDGVPLVALLFDGELVAALPAEPWDRRVTAVVTPSGWTDLA